MSRHQRPKGINYRHWKLEFALEDDQPCAAHEAKRAQPGAPSKEPSARNAQTQPEQPASNQESSVGDSEGDRWRTLLHVAAGVCAALELWL